MHGRLDEEPGFRRRHIKDFSVQILECDGDGSRFAQQPIANLGGGDLLAQPRKECPGIDADEGSFQGRLGRIMSGRQPKTDLGPGAQVSFGGTGQNVLEAAAGKLGLAALQSLAAGVQQSLVDALGPGKCRAMIISLSRSPAVCSTRAWASRSWSSQQGGQFGVRGQFRAVPPPRWTCGVRRPSGQAGRRRDLP